VELRVARPQRCSTAINSSPRRIGGASTHRDGGDQPARVASAPCSTRRTAKSTEGIK
jgi:hypothetical protein